MNKLSKLSIAETRQENLRRFVNTKSFLGCLKDTLKVLKQQHKCMK